MLTLAHPAAFEPGDECAFVVDFRDVPGAITQGDDLPDAMAMAADALGVILLAYVEKGLPLPPASPPRAGERVVSVEPDVAAKLAVLLAFREAGITKAEFARRLGKDEREVRQVLDPMHPTKLPALQRALAVLGRRLVVGVEAVERAA